jgi:ATP-dependent DNA helicase RecG
MPHAEIKKRFFPGDGKAFFYTEDLELDVVGRMVCGMLNRWGGRIVVGTKAAEKVVGEIKTDAEKLAGIFGIEKNIWDKLTPKAVFFVYTDYLCNNKHVVIVVDVPHGKDIPYGFDNVVYVCDNDHSNVRDATVRDATVEEVSNWIRGKPRESVRWERRLSLLEFSEPPLGSQSPKDLNKEMILEVWGKLCSKDKSKGDVSKNGADWRLALKSLSVLQGGRLTNAGDVLFANYPQARLPQTRVWMIECDNKGPDKTEKKSYYDGPLKTVFFKVESEINNCLRELARVSKAKQIPSKVVHEALVNALVHRDYANASGVVKVEICSDCLKISNSGGLPEGLSKEMLVHGGVSVLRNPDIAHVLYLNGIMDMCGRGIGRIRHGCRDAELQDPVWDVATGDVCLTISRNSKTNQTNQTNPPDRSPTTPDDGKPHSVTLPGGVNLEMIWVNGGAFTMGSPLEEKERSLSEVQKEVSIKSYWLGKYPVTQEQWQAVMKNKPFDSPNARHPVVNVSWDEVKNFYEKVNTYMNITSSAKYKYTLPMEAEWEYACRADTMTPFNTGNDCLTPKDANYYQEKSQKSSPETTEVGKFLPNNWGFYDMHGNVNEWCWNKYKSDSLARAYRGGSWENTQSNCRSAYSNAHSSDCKCSNLGFRLALVLSTEIAARDG